MIKKTLLLVTVLLLSLSLVSAQEIVSLNIGEVYNCADKNIELVDISDSLVLFKTNGREEVIALNSIEPLGKVEIEVLSILDNTVTFSTEPSCTDFIANKESKFQRILNWIF
jgi:hypothetical protein